MIVDPSGSPESALLPGTPRAWARLNGSLCYQVFNASHSLRDGNGTDCVWCGRPGPSQHLAWGRTARLCAGCYSIISGHPDREGLDELRYAQELHRELARLVERINEAGEAPVSACWLCSRRGETYPGVVTSELRGGWGPVVAVVEPVLCRQHARAYDVEWRRNLQPA